jgi:hypothetical protein
MSVSNFVSISSIRAWVSSRAPPLHGHWLYITFVAFFLYTCLGCTLSISFACASIIFHECPSHVHRSYIKHSCMGFLSSTSFARALVIYHVWCSLIEHFPLHVLGLNITHTLYTCSALFHDINTKVTTWKKTVSRTKPVKELGRYLQDTCNGQCVK